MIESYQRKEEARAKEILTSNYNLASLIANFVGKNLNGKRLPELYDLYPSLAGDTVEEVSEKKQEVESLRYKAAWMNFMHNANAQRRKRGGATTNDT